MKYFIILCLGVIVIATKLFSQKNCENTWSKFEIHNSLSKGKSSTLPLGSVKLKCNYTDSIKIQLLKCLNDKWSYYDMDSFIESKFVANYEHFYIEERVNKLQPFSYYRYKLWKDSIANMERNNIYQDYKNFFKVNNGIVLNIGYLYIKEAVPILQKAIIDQERYDTRIVELALARIGDKNICKQILKSMPTINNLQDNEWVDQFYANTSILTYLATQDAVKKFEEYIDPKNEFTYLSSGATAKCAYKVLMVLREFLSNKLTDVLKWDVNGIKNSSVDLIVKCKKWLIDNYEKYKIKSNFVPNL
jgi:hypothetical protein